MNLEITLQRSAVQKLANLYEDVNKMPEPNITKPYLDVQSKITMQLWEKIDSTHSVIVKACKEEDLQHEYFLEDEHSKAFTLYNKTLTKIENRLHKITKTENRAQNPIINIPENVVLNNIRSKSNIKLKPIEIPQFEGDYKKWLSFINMFDSLIHANTEINNLQKMHYLSSCLAGEAKRIVSQYSITENNYQIAYDTLRNRYHNEVKLIDTHIIAIVSQPDMLNESGDSIKELLDVTTENIDALSSLAVNTDTWDPILLLLLTQKLDSATRRLWELDLKPNVRPTLKQFLDFLRKRFNVLGCQRDFKFSVTSADTKKTSSTSNHNHSLSYKSKQYTSYSSNQQNQGPSQRFHQTFHAVAPANPIRKCSICSNSNHNIFQCERFRDVTPQERNNLAQNSRLCKNCLWSHQGRCSQQANCRKCGKYHHTFLHIDPTSSSNRNSFTTNNAREQQPSNFNQASMPNQPSNFNQASMPNQPSNFNQASMPNQPSNFNQALNPNQQHSILNTHHAHVQQPKNQSLGLTQDFIGWDEPVLLATAIILVKSARDNLFYPFRCLFDQASETNYMTEETAQFLGLKKGAIVASMSGLGGISTGSAKNVVDFGIGSKYNQSFGMRIQALIVSKISNLLPSSHIQNHNWKHLEGLQLADPSYQTPGKIHILLGGSVYGYLLLPGLIKSTPQEPVVQETEFGWILSGATRPTPINRTIISFHLRIDLDNQLKKFFEQEEISQVRTLTQEEKECKEIFEKTAKRDEEGRIVVTLPFKKNPELLGSSKSQAISRLTKLESRLAKDSKLKGEYTNILDEYESLQHTSLLGNLTDIEPSMARYYLPHHAVFKPDSTTTKTRIVFDASAKTTNNTSLNDLLIVGPTLQDDLMSILLRWRTHKIVFSADIQKMYRQVVVREEDRKYQTFLFRNQLNREIQVYQHNRVVFGVSSATYLAVAALRKIATDGEKRYPKAAKIALKDFYMDDIMSGADNVEEASKLCKDLKELLASGKFDLKKFISNSIELLERMPEEDREIKLPLEIYTESTVKTLGIYYHPILDVFQFKVNITLTTDWPTKRSLLSETSKLFDPLGWLAPVVIRAKILFQELWQEGLEWDEKLPESLSQKWLTFRNELKQLESIQIKRWTGMEKNIKHYELHGFSDGSTKAYSAVVYSRIISNDDTIHVTMLTSKTRVAPLKPMTIPRLELCGAVLLANLMNIVGNALNIEKSNMHAWSDSTVVLGWLQEHPAKFRTFVANRIVEIHNYLDVGQWYLINYGEMDLNG